MFQLPGRSDCAGLLLCTVANTGQRRGLHRHLAWFHAVAAAVSILAGWDGLEKHLPHLWRNTTELLCLWSHHETYSAGIRVTSTVCQAWRGAREQSRRGTAVQWSISSPPHAPAAHQKDKMLPGAAELPGFWHLLSKQRLPDLHYWSDLDDDGVCLTPCLPCALCHPQRGGGTQGSPSHLHHRVHQYFRPPSHRAALRTQSLHRETHLPVQPGRAPLRAQQFHLCHLSWVQRAHPLLHCPQHSHEWHRGAPLPGADGCGRDGEVLQCSRALHHPGEHHRPHRAPAYRWESLWKLAGGKVVIWKLVTSVWERQEEE